MPVTRNPAAVPAPPAPTRADLLARWHAARRRRDGAPLSGEDLRQATLEVGELEVAINALDVEATEGRHVRPARRTESHHS